MTDLENIYICSVRYSLGRMTYITGLVSEYLQKQKLSKHCKRIMIEDIKKCDNYGMDCDKKSWMDLLNYLKK